MDRDTRHGGPTVRTLDGRGRAWRLAVAAAGLVALLAGSAWGADDHFPFGPFRMYATATKTTGVVATPFLIGVDETGREFEVYGREIGLRPAELEGQYPRFREDPSLLGALAAAWNEANPERAPLVELRLMRRRREIVDSRVVGRSESEVAVWRR